jgi:hypothetical protein
MNTKILTWQHEALVCRALWISGTKILLPSSYIAWSRCSSLS